MTFHATTSSPQTTLRRAARAAAGLAASAVAATAGAAAPQVVFTHNTGVDAAQLVLANGLPDGHFTLVAAPAGVSLGTVYAKTTGGPLFPLGGWAGADAVSAWITPFIGAAPGADIGPAGDYVYRTSFDLSGYDVTQSVLLTGHWAADNVGVSIRLNPTQNAGTLGDLAAAGFGNYNVVLPDSFTPTSFQQQWFQASSGFVAGINTLEFVVHNHSSNTGLRVDYVLEAAPVPEPAAWALLAAGGLVVLRLQRRRAPAQPAAEGLNTAASS